MIAGDVGHKIHSTVYWGCSIKADYVENYVQNGGHARKRVNLYSRIADPRLWVGGDESQKKKLQTHIVHR
jgi:hypothetical protein